MGRPNVSTERRSHIFEAAIRSVKRHGSAGTTLALIAAEAQMSRGHVRHFVGNRDQLIVDAARHFYAQYGDRHTPLSSGDRWFKDVDTVLDYLFGPEFTESGDDNAFVRELVAQSRTNAELKSVLVEAYSDLLREISAVLLFESPGSDEKDLQLLAYGILTIALGNVFMGDVGMNRNDLGRRLAAGLVAGL